jgi:hypothetical protein
MSKNNDTKVEVKSDDTVNCDPHECDHSTCKKNSTSLENKLKRKTNNLNANKRTYENQLKLNKKQHDIALNLQTAEISKLKLETNNLNANKSTYENQLKLNKKQHGIALNLKTVEIAKLTQQLKTTNMVIKATPINPFSIIGMSESTLNALVVYKTNTEYLAVECRLIKVPSMAGRVAKLRKHVPKQMVVIKSHPNVCGLWKKTAKQFCIKLTTDKHGIDSFVLDNITEDAFCNMLQKNYDVCK